MAQVTELVTKFSFTGNTAPLGQYNMGLGKSIGLLAGVAAGLAATTIAFNKWASGVLQASDPLVQLARRSAESVAWIQEMGFAAGQTGGSAQALESSVESLASKIGEAAQKGSEDFARLGISVRDVNGQVKSTEEVFGEIQSRFRQMNLSRNEKKSFAASLGIDESLIGLLSQTSESINGLRARARELGTINEEQAEQIVKYNDALAAMRFGLDATKTMIAIGVAPELTNLAEKFTQLLDDNKEWIVDGIQAAAGFLGELMDSLKRMWPVLLTAAAAFVAVELATAGWVGVLKVLGKLPIILLITGIFMAIDDLIVAMRGGQSVIRDFFQEFFGWDIVPALDDIISGFKDLVSLVKALSAGDLDLAAQIVQEANARVSGSVLGNPLYGETTVNDGMLRPDEIPQVPGARNDNRTVEQRVNIEIKTNDPDRAGQAVGDVLQRQLEDAQTQFGRGGR